MKLKLLRQLLKMSKVTLYAFIINAILLLTLYAAGDPNIQSIKSIREVSLHLALKNASLIDVFKSIEVQTGYQFPYRPEGLNLAVRITIDFNEPAKTAHGSENFINENMSEVLRVMPSLVYNLSYEFNHNNV